MFALLVTAFLLFPSTVGTVYFLERAWLLIRADEALLNAVLDRDVLLGQQLWISLKGLLAPPELL